MKKIIAVLLLAGVFFGCSSEGDLKFINRTGHSLYFNVKDTDYVLDGSEDVDSPNTKTISVDTGSKFLFWGGDSKKIDIYLEGETFLMQEADISGHPNGLYTTETTVTVNPDETTKIYCDPTHAGVKLINYGETTVINLDVSKNQGNYSPLFDGELLPGEEFWARLQASTDDYPIFYSFRIVDEDYNAYIIDVGELEKDEQEELLFTE